MDYVKRRLEELRHQRSEGHIEEAMTRHKLAQESPPTESKSAFTFETVLSYFRKSHNAFLVLTGIAAGVLITTVISRVDPARIEIKHAMQDIGVLTKRVEVLSGNITTLEDKLTHVLEIADSIEGYENRLRIGDKKTLSEPADGRPAGDSVEPDAAPVALKPPANKETFTPTHTVATKLNLRPTASLNATPIGVLPAGTKVQKIRKNGDWYYVNTEKYGKGWCFSDYLHPLR